MGEGFGVLVEARGKTDGVGEIETETLVAEFDPRFAAGRSSRRGRWRGYGW
jgi:hypothetical protein